MRDVLHGILYVVLENIIYTVMAEFEGCVVDAHIVPWYRYTYVHALLLGAWD